MQILCHCLFNKSNVVLALSVLLSTTSMRHHSGQSVLMRVSSLTRPFLQNEDPFHTAFF